MMVDEGLSRPDLADDPSAWPVVSPDRIAVADFQCDLAYMGLYLRLEICNRSPHLVREAELRVDGKGPGSNRVVTSRILKLGPLFPGEWVHEEVGIGERGGITGVSFEPVTAYAVRLTPPGEMVPATEYPALVAEVVDVTVTEEATDLRVREENWWGELPRAAATAIRIRVRNTGPAVVERARLNLQYFEVPSNVPGGRVGWQQEPDVEWTLDMPRSDWNPYRLPPAPHAACDPADALPPGQVHEFTLVHFGGGPHDWAGCLEATSVEVTEVKLRR